MLIKACLNGARPPGSHPALPLTPEALAREAAAAVRAGAGALHMHPRGADGRESLDATVIGAAVTGVRAACPGVPVGVSTGAWIEPDPARRLAAVRAWRVQPDFASVNFSEDGAETVAEALLAAAVGVEAGLWSEADARRLLASGLAERCVRLLIEPVRQPGLDEALAITEAILRVLDEAGVRAPRLLHGGGDLAWPLLEEALRRGLDTRIGLEDTLTLPDGDQAADNAALVAAACAMAAQLPAR
jgi:uncharacterized protein (DUF849 family)